MAHGRGQPEGIIMSVDLSERWLSYLATLSWTKGQLDVDSYCAFLRAASCEIDPARAIEEVAIRIRDAGDAPRPGKLRAQQQRAYQYADASPGNPVIRWSFLSTKPTYQPEKLETVAAKIHVVDEEYLRLRSKFTVHNRAPAGVLHKLFQPGEKVLLFTEYTTQGEELWTQPGAVGDLVNLDRLHDGHQGVWFLCNPVDGEFHWNPRQQTYSRRSEESINSFRYAVIESDEAPRDLWLRALVRIPLPIAAITDSGGESIHSIVRVDANSKADWDKIVRGKLLGPLTRLGADPQALTAVRLTRLPNCNREQTGRLQRLLYLDDNPADVPICQIAPRDPDTLRKLYEHGTV
jgi:hypothetical protein